MRSTRVLTAVLALALIGASTGQSAALATTSLPHSQAWSAASSQPELIEIAQKKPVAKGKSQKAAGKPKSTTKKAVIPAKKAPATAKTKKPANVNVRVVKRPSGWRGRHWGVSAFGVTLGAIIIVAANTPPPLPDPSLCWTWTNTAMTQGYWYYCTGE